MLPLYARRHLGPLIQLLMFQGSPFGTATSREVHKGGNEGRERAEDETRKGHDDHLAPLLSCIIIAPAPDRAGKRRGRGGARKATRAVSAQRLAGVYIARVEDAHVGDGGHHVHEVVVMLHLAASESLVTLDDHPGQHSVVGLPPYHPTRHREVELVIVRMRSPGPARYGDLSGPLLALDPAHVLWCRRVHVRGVPLKAEHLCRGLQGLLSTPTREKSGEGDRQVVVFAVSVRERRVLVQADHLCVVEVDQAGLLGVGAVLIDAQVVGCLDCRV